MTQQDYNRLQLARDRAAQAAALLVARTRYRPGAPPAWLRLAERQQAIAAELTTLVNTATPTPE